MFIEICAGLIAITIAFLLLSTTLLYIHDMYLIKKKQMPNGPPSLPIIGGMYLLDLARPHLSVEKLFHQYGSTFSIRFGQTERVVMTKDMAVIQTVFRNRCAANRPEVPFMKLLEQGYGQGIGSVRYGPTWKIHTKVCHAAIANLTNSLSDDIIDKNCRDMIDRFKENGNQPVNPMTSHFQMSFKCTESLVYGETYGEDDLKQKMADHQIIMNFLKPTHPINAMPCLRHFPLNSTKNLFSVLHNRDLFLRKTYAKHEENLHETDNRYTDVTEAVIISKLSANDQETVERLSANNILTTLWALNVAGIDTMQIMMSWILLYLGLNQQVVCKAQEILDETIGDRMPIAMDKQDVPYIDAIVAETLRIVSPVIIGVPHFTTEDLHFDNFTIPKDTSIFPCSWSVHHDPDLWTNPFQYQPERFLKPDGKLMNLRNINGFIPFSRGHRMCIGNYFATTVLFVYTAQILKSFDLKLLHEESIDLCGSVSMNLDPMPYEIILTERTSSTNSKVHTE